MTDILPPAGWPNVRQLETNEFASGGANGNMNEQAKSLAARSELLKQYAALPYKSKTGGYALNERVQLATGDIVRSTIASNVNNPNVNMTGWVNRESISRSVLDYGARSNENSSQSFDSTQAFKDALDFEWVVYPAATSLAYYPKSKNKRVRVPLGRYLITDTLPLTSYLHMDFDDGVVIEFKPVTKKSLFDLPIQKMKDAYNGGATTWKDMTLYGVRFTGAAILKGNMTRNSTVHADYAIHASNSQRGLFSRFAIEGFENGLVLDRLDTSSWTGGGSIGNFYENVVDNVSIQDCKNCFYNEANLTTVINSRMGHETIGKTDPNMGDYIVVNKGAGFTSLNLNIASLARYNNPKIGHIFEQCKGSTYHGLYSEYFDSLFVVDPITRGGGLNIDTGYIVKYPSDFLIRYVDGYMPSYNPATGLRGGRNLKGANAWIELFNGGIQIMNSNPSLLEDFFEFAPQYDFKYGMYGVGVPWAQNIATDFKRWETKETGFLSTNGARFIATQSTSLYFPVKQNQYDAYVCVLIRDLIGNYNSDNIKINVVIGSNTFITVAENIYDYGNGWKMIAVRNVQTDPAAKTNLIVEIPAGCQIEIEHIGAYLNGVPLYPNFKDYKPRVNSDSYCYSSFNDSAGGGYIYKYSGGQFGLGDELSPFIPKLPDGSIVTTEVIANQYISQEGSNRATLKDGNHAAYYGNANITFANANTFDSAVTATGNSRNFAESIGVGQYVGITQDAVLTADAKVIDRVYSVPDSKYTTSLVLNKNFNVAVAIANHYGAQKPVYKTVRGVDVAKTLTGSKTIDPDSLAANAIQSTTVTVTGAKVGDTVNVSFSVTLGLSSRMWGEVTALNTVTVYLQNLTAAPVDIATGILTVKVSQ